MTSMSWLLFLAVAGLIASNLILLWMLKENSEKLMQISCAHSGIQIPSMADKDKSKTEPKPDTRKRLSIPVPTGAIR